MGEVEEIRYDTRVGARWLVLFLWALVVMMALQVVLSWRNMESLLLTGLNVAFLFALLALAGRTLRPTWLVVDEHGITRPMRRPIPWSDIEAVLRPGRFDKTLRVTLRGGRTVPLVLPKQHAEQVARIGDRPLVDPQKPT